MVNCYLVITKSINSDILTSAIVFTFFFLTPISYIVNTPTDIIMNRIFSLFYNTKYKNKCSYSTIKVTNNRLFRNNIYRQQKNRIRKIFKKFSEFYFGLLIATCLIQLFRHHFSFHVS